MYCHFLNTLHRNWRLCCWWKHSWFIFS